MKAWNQSYFFSLFHYFNAWLFLKKILLAKHIDKLRVYFSFVHRCLYCWNLAFNHILGLFCLGFAFRYGMCPAKSGDHLNFACELIPSDFNCSEHFNLRLSIKAITWFDLNCSGTEPVHFLEILLKVYYQIIQRCGAYLFGRKPDPQSQIVDISIVHSI